MWRCAGWAERPRPSSGDCWTTAASPSPEAGRSPRAAREHPPEIALPRPIACCSAPTLSTGRATTPAPPRPIRRRWRPHPRGGAATAGRSSRCCSRCRGPKPARRRRSSPARPIPGFEARRPRRTWRRAVSTRLSSCRRRARRARSWSRPSRRTRARWSLGRRTGGIGPGTLQGLRAAPSRDPPDARGHLLGPRRRGVGEADAGRGAERRRGDARGPALRIDDRLDQEEAPGVSLNPAGPRRLARPHPVVTETMRLDVTLFELRLFKSRSQASLAVQDGAVLLNGEVVKPSHGVRPGDRVTLVGADGRRTLEVLALPRISLSKEAARTLVRDLGDAP